MLRQGDVLLIPLAKRTAQKLLQSTKSQNPTGRGLVLAEGEATGHAHVLVGAGATLFRDEKLNRLFLTTSDAGALVEHDEHSALSLGRNKFYEVRRQREYTPQQARFVAD